MRQAGDVTYADAHKTRKNEGVVEFACKNVSLRKKIKRMIPTILS